MGRHRRLLCYVLRQGRWLAAIGLLTLGSSLVGALHPWPMKLLIDYALGDKSAPAAARWLAQGVGLELTPAVMVVAAAMASLLLFALGSAAGVALGLCWTVGGQRMVCDLAGDLFARLQRLSLSFHGRRSVGDSLSRLTEDSWCVYSVANGLLISPIQQVITLATLGCIGFALDPMLAGVALGTSPLLAASSTFFGKRLKQRSKLGREAKSRLMSFVHQTLGAIPVVQAFGTEGRNTRRFQSLADDAVALAQRGNLLGGMYGLVNGLITHLGTAIVLYVGGVRVLAGAISIGTLLIFIAYVRQMQSASGALFQTFAKLKAAEASLDRVFEIIDSEEAVPEAAVTRTLAGSRDGRRGHVRLEGVTFGYGPQRPVLEDVSLEARPGETIALVGPTGAGKSTLVSLIPRFFDPWQGQVNLDGVDLRELKLAELRSQVSILFQEPYLLPLSVADNIAYGLPGASRPQIIAAAEAACADAFVRRLPNGYDTIIGERGATLSGGERLRIAIARALLKDAPVLILDEPTSALDAQTESLLLEALQRLMEGRTTFLIAHRLSTIRNADRIAVLQSGRIIEVGAHEELLAAEGLYYRLHCKQFGGLPREVVA